VAIANPLNNGSKAIEKSYVAETGSRSYRCMLQLYASIFLVLHDIVLRISDISAFKFSAAHKKGCCNYTAAF
jgi:hypothetical protein